MRIIITGGHFSPAYSVIKKLSKEDEVLVLGRKSSFEGDTGESLEYKICRENKIPFKEVRAGRLQRKMTRYTLPSLIKVPVGFWDANKALMEFKPDVILTFGGYVALPVAIAAKIQGVPVILHEQTQHAGLAAKLISKISVAVCISFESSKKYFKNKNLILTGNPIREEVLSSNTLFDITTDKPIIYITGGSSGSHVINSLVRKILPELLERYAVVHQAGDVSTTGDFNSLSEVREVLPSDQKDRYILRRYFSADEVGWLFKNAELVISRSGVNTVLELMALGSVALLIPLPVGQKNEQRENAKLYAKTGLGKYFEQDELTPRMFLDNIHDMIEKHDTYSKNRNNAKQYVVTDAAERIIEVLKKYGRGSIGPTQREKTPQKKDFTV